MGSADSWTALGARKAEVMRPFSFGGHRTSTEGGPLVSEWYLNESIQDGEKI